MCVLPPPPKNTLRIFVNPFAGNEKDVEIHTAMAEGALSLPQGWASHLFVQKQQVEENLKGIRDFAKMHDMHFRKGRIAIPFVSVLKMDFVTEKEDRFYAVDFGGAAHIFGKNFNDFFDETHYDRYLLQKGAFMLECCDLMEIAIDLVEGDAHKGRHVDVIELVVCLNPYVIMRQNGEVCALSQGARAICLYRSPTNDGSFCVDTDDFDALCDIVQLASDTHISFRTYVTQGDYSYFVPSHQCFEVVNFCRMVTANTGVFCVAVSGVSEVYIGQSGTETEAAGKAFQFEIMTSDGPLVGKEQTGNVTEYKSFADYLGGDIARERVDVVVRDLHIPNSTTSEEEFTIVSYHHPDHGRTLIFARGRPK